MAGQHITRFLLKFHLDLIVVLKALHPSINLNNK